MLFHSQKIDRMNYDTGLSLRPAVAASAHIPEIIYNAAEDELSATTRVMDHIVKLRATAYIVTKTLFRVVERSSDWIDQAEGDLEHAKNDLKYGFYEWACFSAQQSAEKSVKAVFQKLGAEVWGHSVYDLLIGLREKMNVDEVLLEYALELDKAYIPTRYPNVHPSSSPRRRYTKTEAERLIKYAEEILKFCKNTLSKL